MKIISFKKDFGLKLHCLIRNEILHAMKRLYLRLYKFNVSKIDKGRILKKKKMLWEPSVPQRDCIFHDPSGILIQN